MADFWEGIWVRLTLCWTFAKRGTFVKAKSVRERGVEGSLASGAGEIEGRYFWMFRGVKASSSPSEVTGRSFNGICRDSSVLSSNPQSSVASLGVSFGTGAKTSSSIHDVPVSSTGDTSRLSESPGDGRLDGVPDDVGETWASEKSSSSTCIAGCFPDLTGETQFSPSNSQESPPRLLVGLSRFSGDSRTRGEKYRPSCGREGVCGT